jgi:hypothetical protein
LDAEDAAVFADADFVAAMLDAVADFDREWLPVGVPFAALDDLRAVFPVFDFDLLVAIWISLA